MPFEGLARTRDNMLLVEISELVAGIAKRASNIPAGGVGPS